MIERKSMNKTMKSILLSLPLVVLTAACHSNPYDGQNTARLSQDPPVKHSTLPGFTVEAPAVVDMTEGDSNVKIPVTAHVLSGTPIITVEGLPSFATWDASSSSVILNPPIGSSVDPAAPAETTRKYTMLIKATSTDAGMSFVQQTVLVLVHHKAESLVVTGFNSQVDLPEGAPYSTTFKIQSLTFPAGPFYPVANSLPDGVTIAPTTDPTIFTITYNPNFRTVTSSNATSLCQDAAGQDHMCLGFDWTLNVTDPRGDAATVSTRWKVLDVRQDPLFTPPDNVDGTTSTVDFYVHAEDPNGERIPDVTSAADPSVGTLTLTSVSNVNGTATTNPSTLVHVVWSGDLSSLADTTQSLSFKTCVKTAGAVPDTCITSNVQVKIHGTASDLVVAGLAPTSEVLEGQTFQATVQVTSASFPTGPFFVNGTNLPDGMNVAPTADPTKFTVTYTPGFTSLLMGGVGSAACTPSAGGSALCRDINWKLNVVDPKGSQATISSKLTLVDIRQSPALTIPSSIAGTVTGADFYVQVQDPNGEIAPQVTVAQPASGAVTVTIVASSPAANGSLPFSVAHVVWSGAALSPANPTPSLQVTACVNDINGQVKNCSTMPATVTVN
jgi:hypothetical protein